MKKFELMGQQKDPAKMQLRGESLMRASKSDKAMLCSVLCDCAGLAVLLHEKNERRADDKYYLSRWETDPERMIAILVWVARFSVSGKDFDSTRFVMTVQPPKKKRDNGDTYTEGSTSSRKRTRNEEKDSTTSAKLSPVKERKEKEEEDKEMTSAMLSPVQERAEKDEEIECIYIDIICSHGSWAGDSWADDSEDEDKETPGRIYSSIRNYMLYGTPLPLWKENLRFLDKRARLENKERVFILSKGKWDDISAIDKVGELKVQ